MAGREAKSRIKDVYSHPVGRDAIDKVLLQLGRSRRWVTNPLVANLPLGVLGRLARPILGPGFVGSLLEVLTSHPEVADSGGAAPKPPGVGEPARRSEERRVGKECRSRWATYVISRKNEIRGVAIMH